MKLPESQRIWRIVAAFLAWQCCLLGGAAAEEIVTINFDTFLDGTPIPEGSIIIDQYADVGVTVSAFNTEAVSGDSNFVGASLPNVLSLGFAPGPGGGLQCQEDFKVRFASPVSSVSLLVFATADLPDQVIGLLAKDLNGNIMDQDSLIVAPPPVLLTSAILHVSSSTFNISSVETTGVDGTPDAARCIAVDNLSFTQLATKIAIDIKPGSFPNSLNPKSHGVIPVAILTTDTFDATTVDPLSIRFGPKEAQEAHGKGHIQDMNHDGEPDLMLHFRTQTTGIQCGQTSVSLTGETFDGDSIQGSDSIKTVGCNKY